MRGSAIASAIALIIAGTIIADIITHPQGTQAAGNAIAGIWNPSLKAVAGQTI